MAHGFYMNWYILSLWKLHLEITIVTTSYNFLYESYQMIMLMPHCDACHSLSLQVGFHLERKHRWSGSKHARDTYLLLGVMLVTYTSSGTLNQKSNCSSRNSKPRNSSSHAHRTHPHITFSCTFISRQQLIARIYFWHQ